MNSSTLGAAAEYVAAARLSSIGYQVFWPMDPSSPFDLLIGRKNDYLKVQVKKTRWRNGGHSRRNQVLVVTTCTRTRDKKAKQYAYGDFDLLCAVDGFRIWLIPFEFCRGTTELSLDKRGVARMRNWPVKGYDPAQWLVE